MRAISGNTTARAMMIFEGIYWAAQDRAIYVQQMARARAKRHLPRTAIRLFSRRPHVRAGLAGKRILRCFPARRPQAKGASGLQLRFLLKTWQEKSSKNLRGCSPRIHLGLRPHRSQGFLSFATADRPPPYSRIVTAGLAKNLPRSGAAMARMSQPAVTPERVHFTPR